MPALRLTAATRLAPAAVLLGLSAAAPRAAYAQGGVVAPVETVTVTGSRLTSATSAGSTFARATIDARDKPSVPALLADATGVSTSLPGGRGSVGEVLLRGAEPNFSAVFIDGVQVNDPTNTRGGSFDFATLTLDEIETIEVLTGPLSSIYGSDALGGIINVVTRRPSDRFGLGGTLAAGTESYARYSARVTGPVTEQSTFLVNVANARDGHTDSSASARSNVVNGLLELTGKDDTTRVTLHARGSDSAFMAFPDSSGGPLLAEIRDRASRDASDATVGATLETMLTERHVLNVRASALDHEEIVTSPGVAPGPGGAIPANRSNTDFSRRNVTAYVSSAYGAAIETAVGISYEQQTGDSVGAVEIAPGVELPTGYALDRDNRALFFELGLPIADTLQLQAALRVDDSDSAASATTRRISLEYRPGAGRARVHLSAAEGYKLPSLFALGDPLTGNSTLRPETATSWEVGIDVGTPAMLGALGFTLFSQRFDDLIDFDFDSFRNVNRDRVDTDGIEWHGHRQLNERMTVTGTFTWLDIDVVGSDSALRQRPERFGTLGLAWRPSSAVHVYAGLRRVGPRLDESIPTGERTLASYTSADVAVRWQLSPTLSLGVAVDDVTDERFEDAIGFPSLGRRYRVSLSATLPAS